MPAFNGRQLQENPTGKRRGLCKTEECGLGRTNDSIKGRARMPSKKKNENLNAAVRQSPA